METLIEETEQRIIDAIARGLLQPVIIEIQSNWNVTSGGFHVRCGCGHGYCIRFPRLPSRCPLCKTTQFVEEMPRDNQFNTIYFINCLQHKP